MMVLSLRLNSLELRMIMRPACWEMDWAEVAVLDGNAKALGIDPSVLMKAAGVSIAEKVADVSDGGGIVFLCGPGNNGGDGFTAANHLAGLGHEIIVIASHSKSKSPEAISAREGVSEVVDVQVWPSKPDGGFSLIVDCLLGAGAAGPGVDLRGSIADIVDWARSLEVPVLACDIPTGMGSEGALTADYTVTFHSTKRGFNAYDCGEITVATLPWPREVEDCGRGDIERYPAIDEYARKGDRGRLLVIGGGPFHGAPILAGMAAARSGCDLVHVAMPSLASRRVEWPPTLIREELPDNEILTTASIESISAFLESSMRPDAMVIGPGLGREEEVTLAVSELLDLAVKKGVPVVVDADGISALPKGSWPLGLIGVATPHSKEAARWLGESLPSHALSDLFGECVSIVVTGPVDEITGPEGRHCYSSGGNPRMAVGGTGDLLAGAIGGMMAQGMTPWAASRLGSAAIREAGGRAAKSIGPGLIAEDVPVHISQTLESWLGD